MGCRTCPPEFDTALLGGKDPKNGNPIPSPNSSTLGRRTEDDAVEWRSTVGHRCAGGKMMSPRSNIALGAALALAMAYMFMAAPDAPSVNTAGSPAGSSGVDEPAYSRLVSDARAGDCNAAYKLGRHHVFFSLNTNEAIRWYRLAAQCPNPNAKGELLGILMHFESHDAEVDRLLLEIEQIDPHAAGADREAVRSVRARRKPAAH